MNDEVISFFSTLEQRPLLRLAILVSGLVFFWLLEGVIPLKNNTYIKNKWRHAGVNFVFTVLHLIIHTAIAIAIVLLSDWCKAQQFGIVYWASAGIGLTIVVSVLALDFSSWLVHLVMHKVSVLWFFHLIHHSDTNVDATTGLRHHPGDSILRGIFFIIFIFISGAPIYAVMIFQTLAVISTAFTHANIRLPVKVDNLLSYFIISPNMHKVHHHYKQPYTDSNYGSIFSIWDRLLGTHKHLPIEDVHYGIDRYYPKEEEDNLPLLFKRPFMPKDSFTEKDDSVNL